MPESKDEPALSNTPGQDLFASLVGTTIEFFDFYIYGTAAVLVFPHLFFPADDSTSGTLKSLASFHLLRPVPSRPERHAKYKDAFEGRAMPEEKLEKLEKMTKCTGRPFSLLPALC